MLKCVLLVPIKIYIDRTGIDIPIFFVNGRVGARESLVTQRTFLGVIQIL